MNLMSAECLQHSQLIEWGEIDLGDVANKTVPA